MSAVSKAIELASANAMLALAAEIVVADPSPEALKLLRLRLDERARVLNAPAVSDPTGKL